MLPLVVTGVLAATLLLIAIVVTINLFLARYRAIKAGRTEVDLVWGWVKLILWQPNEGVMVLRNKKIHFIDEEGTGGTKFIFPIKGDELEARVPLTIRLVSWEDDRVLTKESLQVRVKVAVWWRISSMKEYVFDIDRSVHVEGPEDAGRLLPDNPEHSHRTVGLVESSEAWLKAITESSMRILASRSGAAELVSSKPMEYLSRVVDGGGTRQVTTTVTESTVPAGIALELKEELSNKVSGYGIGINRVEIQEIRLAPEVQEAIDKVRLAFLKPVQSEQEARARQIELEATASVLGTSAVALTEIFKQLGGTNMYMVPPFFQNLFGIVDQKAKDLEKEPVRPVNRLAGETPKLNLPSGAE